MEDYQQKETGAMAYPKKGRLNRLLFKFPLVIWRLGLGPILSHEVLGGSKMLVLTTWGRKSGLPRHTMLSYVSIGEKPYVCSGWGERSDWYKNAGANPNVTLQVGKEVFPVRARRVQDIEEFQQIAEEMFTTGGDSHFESWLESYGIDFNQQDMLDKRGRLYLVAFDKSEGLCPPPMRADLIWIWGVILALIIAWVIVRR